MLRHTHARTRIARLGGQFRWRPLAPQSVWEDNRLDGRESCGLRMGRSGHFYSPIVKYQQGVGNLPIGTLIAERGPRAVDALVRRQCHRTRHWPNHPTQIPPQLETWLSRFPPEPGGLLCYSWMIIIPNLWLGFSLG
jgi:hypothetical protein